jgi:hypothetical protein
MPVFIKRMALFFVLFLAHGLTLIFQILLNGKDDSKVGARWAQEP